MGSSGFMGVGLLLGLVLLVGLGPVLYPLQNQGPPLAPPGKEHPLGTDDLGQDIAHQLLLGGRTSLQVAFAVSLSATLLGTVVGFVAGFYGGLWDAVLSCLIDLTLGLPQFLVIIVLAAWLGPSLRNTILVLTLFSWMMPARLIRANTAQLKEARFVKAARSYGAGPLYLFFRHLLPSLAPLMGLSALRVANRAVMAEAGLALLGLGDPTVPSWGQLIRQALAFPALWHTDFWKWWLLAPQVAITWVMLALALVYRGIDGTTHGK